MATLTVKNFPDNLYADLTRAAKKNRRSLNSEAIVTVERGIDRDDEEAHQRFLEELDRFREDMAAKGVWVTDEALRQSRAELEARPKQIIADLRKRSARSRSAPKTK
jgi:plasmid stability protein